MFIVPFKSESGDSYLIGPFPHPPTQEMVMQVFRISCPDEAEYLEEMVQDGMYNGSPLHRIPTPLERVRGSRPPARWARMPHRRALMSFMI